MSLFSEKHGTCSYPVVHDEYEYFQTTLIAYFKYNVTVSWSLFYLFTPINFALNIFYKI